MGTFLVVLEFFLAILLIVVVMLQPSKQDGLRGFIGGGAQDTFFSRNKGRTSEVMYARATVILAALMALNTILIHYFV
ncbi:hypothetical protein ABB02_02093 [Clostridiaceae bacterium JG1575]|nr:hypothetical protein ABB02_02093 [Clostridiaceae bacterium JG1575]